MHFDPFCLFLCLTIGSLLGIVPFGAIIDLFASKIFSGLSFSCHLQQWSNVCHLPSTKIPLTMAIFYAILAQSIFEESFSVLFLRAKLGGVRWIVICITSNPSPTSFLISLGAISCEMSGRRLEFGLFQISLWLLLALIRANSDVVKTFSAWFILETSQFLIFYILYKNVLQRILNWLWWVQLCANSLFRFRLVIG